MNVDQVDASGKTPLHCCCWFGNRQSEVALIAKKASVNVKDKSGDTPLHLACMHNYGDIVFDLLRAGADPKIKNQFNKTPEEVAEAADHGEIVELLQKKGEAEKKKIGLTALDKNIVYEQRQMTKMLDELLSQQEKHADLIKQLRNKVLAQSNNLSATNAQQISLQNKINEMRHFAQSIARNIDILIPKNSSRYQVTRIPAT